ncbi:TATA element modulatory factor [Plasmodium yoelii yoelii]|uniref:TATA element modulatory factor n=1 Tax=Plasmodium yoelii yoelii TaxID=73239 RepID=Q7R8K1_PLAYO|nr:TATA element modulatory factor [Plasmodium yoelii yoelii]
MKYAEYYVKQNIVSLNIQFDIFTKSFINYLLTSKIALNHVKASIIIKKKKNIKNFHLYKVKFTLIYNHKNYSENDKKILSIKKCSDKNNSYNAESSIKGENDGAQNAFPSKKIQLNCVNYSVNKREDNSVHIEKREHNEIYEKDAYKKYNNNNNSLNSLRYNKLIKKEEIYFSKYKNLDIDEKICTDKCINTKTENENGTKKNEMKKRSVEIKQNDIHCNNNNNETKMNTFQTLKGKNEEKKKTKFENNKFCDLNSILEIQEIFSKGEFSKEINIQLKEKKKKMCKYIMLPSMLTILNGKIKSINFVLNKKLSIILLVEIIVNRKNSSFFDICKNRELDNMLKLKENIIQCKPKYPLIENNPDKYKENLLFHEKKKTTDHFKSVQKKILGK